MSPIGRVFIVLNLLLAGTFVGFSGTYLQKQHNFKDKAEKLQTQLTDATSKWDAERIRLESDRNNFENAKTAAETAKGGLETELKNTKDENDTLSRRLAAMEGAVAKINGDLASANTQAQAAFAQSQEAYKSSMAAQQAKDDAVRAKDSAEDENRNLKTTVAALEATVQTKVAEFNDLKKDRNELALLVKIAQQKGFTPALAAPALDGKVTGVAAEGRLCTIALSEAAMQMNLEEHLATRSFSFAIFDASGYKGEAVVQEYHKADNAVTCRMVPGVGKGSIQVGDSATTKTP